MDACMRHSSKRRCGEPGMGRGLQPRAGTLFHDLIRVYWFSRRCNKRPAVCIDARRVSAPLPPRAAAASSAGCVTGFSACLR
jgi:hypothetical protein